MKKHFPVAILLLAAVAAAATAGPLVPAHLPADTKWVIHLNIDAIKSSQLARECCDDAQKEKVVERLEVMVDKIGLNPAKDLLGATIYDAHYGSREGVMLIHVARMDQDKLVELLKKKEPDHKTSKYGERTIYTWEMKHRHHKQELSGTFANDKTIVIASDEKHIKMALDVIDGKSESLQKKSDVLKGVSKKAMFVVRAIDVDPEYMETTRCPVLRICTAAAAQYAEKDGELQAKYRFTTKIAEDAEQLGKAIEGLKALAALRIGDAPKGKQLLDAVKIKSSDTTVSIRFSAESKSLIAMAKEQMKKWRDRRHKHRDDKNDRDDDGKKKKKDKE